MGTRADFYVGRGQDAEWLGSVSWDGYPDGFDTRFYQATTEDEYRQLIAKVAEERDDWTRPDEGWPWPWNTSSTTDYAYAFDDGHVYAAYSDYWWKLGDDLADPYGVLEEKHGYNTPEYDDAVHELEKTLTRVNYPDMSASKMSTDGIMSRSGTIVVTLTSED